MRSREFDRRIAEIRKRDPRYRLEAFEFVHEALTFTVRRLGREAKGEAERHVTGTELLLGIRDFALGEFGPLAKIVFDRWGVRATGDFGEIVFLLIEAGLLSKTAQDTKEEFKNAFDFEEAFERGFRIEPALQKSE